jgi:hypothetical protein
MRSKLLWILIFLFSTLTFGEREFKLTDDEKQWITDNGEVVVYLEKDTGLLNFSYEGKELGVFPRVLDKIEKDTGLRFRKIHKDESQLISSIDKGIPDVVFGLKDYRRNTENYIYLEKPLPLKGMVMSKIEYPIIDFNRDVFDEKMVYVGGNKIVEQIREKYGNNLNLIEKPNEKSAIESVLSGEADIYVEDFQKGLSYLVKNPETGIKINSVTNGFVTNYHVGVKKDKELLYGIIKKTLENIDREKIVYDEILEYTKDDDRILARERAYLKKKQLLRVYYPENEEYPSLFGVDENGNKTGFLADYFNEMSKIFGIEIIIEKADSFNGFDINSMVLTVNGNKVDNKNIVSLNPYTEIQLYILNGIEDKYIYNFEIEKSKK